MNASSTRLGLLNQMWATPSVSDREAVQTALDEIALADALGFDSVWIGEHHTVRTENAYYGRIPAPEVFLAYIAARTTQIRVGTGVKVLPSTTALRAAEEMSMLDLLAQGRTEFGLGLGAGFSTTRTREQKAAEYQSLLADILRLLRGDRSTGLPELSPKPDPCLPDRIWIACRDIDTIRFAAERHLNFVVGQAEIGPRQALLTRQYREAGGCGRTRGVRVVFAAETYAEAERESEAAVRLYFGQMAGKSYHKEAVDAGDLPPEATTLAEMRRQVAFIAGTPDQCAAELNAYAGQLQLDQIDVMVQVPDLPTDAVRRSLTLIQNHVRPLLRNAASNTSALSGTEQPIPQCAGSSGGRL